MSWSRAFEDPIPGIRTLRDAARYIQKLPKAQQQLPHWQAATEALIIFYCVKICKITEAK